MRAISSEIAAAFKGLNSTLGQLSTQITLLTEQQTALDAAVADIAAQQAVLAAQQSTITTLLSEQVKATSFGVANNAYTLTNTFALAVSTTVTVPAGYTKAILYATNQMAADISSTGSNIGAYSKITSPAGFNDSPNMLNNAAGGFDASVTAVVRHSATGLTGGSTITIEGFVFASAPGVVTGFPTVTLNGICLFLK
jgi:hypothetical protein